MTAPPSPTTRRIAWTLRGLAIAFLTFDMAIKVSHVLFPVDVALLLWGGLYLQEPRLRALIPIRR